MYVHKQYHVFYVLSVNLRSKVIFKLNADYISTLRNLWFMYLSYYECTPRWCSRVERSPYMRMVVCSNSCRNIPNISRKNR